jgi:RNA polymerase sigma factor (sigma-70 family)
LVATGDPDPYVRRVLYHLHISWWRRREAPVAHRDDAGEAATTPDPGDAIAVSVPVRRALALLAPRQRAVLVLRYFEDLSEAQTAEILGISVGTVKSQARDGLARLRLLAPDLASVTEAEA